MNNNEEELFLLLQTVKKQAELGHEQQAKMDKFLNELPKQANQIFKNGLNDAQKTIQSDINKQCVQATAQLERATNEAEKAINGLKAQRSQMAFDFGVKILGTSFIFCFVFGLIGLYCFKLFVPSLDVIRQRQQTVKILDSQNGDLDIQSCNGKLCVRIMKKKCYGEHKDYCEIDFKPKTK